MKISQFDFLSEDSASLRGADSRNQNEIVRDYLQANPNRWIAMPILAKLITKTGVGAAVHSRIDNCRHLFGMTIHNRIRRPAGQSKSWYLYEPADSTAQT